MICMFIGSIESEKIVSKYVESTKSEMITKKDFAKLNQYDTFPLYIKLCSKTLIHKVGLGGVYRIQSKQELEKMYNEILTKFKQLKCDYLQIQKEVKGYEFICGIKTDDKWGRVIMLGIGGSNTETIDDVCFRKLPITKNDAKSMLSDLKNQAYITNVNKELLSEFLYNIQHIEKKCKELDINPVMVDKKAVAVDSKVYR